MAPLYFSLTLAFVVWSLHCRAVRPMFSWEYFTLYLYCTYSAIELPPPPGNMLIFSIFCFKNGFNKFPCILLHSSRNLTWNYQIFLQMILQFLSNIDFSSLCRALFFLEEKLRSPLSCVSEQSRHSLELTATLHMRQWRQLCRKFGYFDVADQDCPLICMMLPVPRHQGECKPHASFQPEFIKNQKRSERNHFSIQINIFDILFLITFRY